MPEVQQPEKVELKPVAQLQTEPPKRGRPKAKRSDPDYEQVTAYIKRNTHTAVKIELLKSSQNGEKREFSELVQDLLEQWLNLRTWNFRYSKTWKVKFLDIWVFNYVT